MKEIKSFREYIAEQELLKEGVYDDDFKKSEQSRQGIEPGEQQKNIIATSVVGKNAEEQQAAPSENKSEPKNEPLKVSEIDFKITSRTPQEKVKELTKKAEIIKNTFERLDEFIYNKGVVKVPASSVAAPIAAITGEESFEKIRTFWEQEFKNSIGQQKEIRQGQYWQKVLRNPFASKEKKAKARAELAKLAPSETEKLEEPKTEPEPKQNNSAEEKSEAEAAKRFFLQKEETIEEAWHPFKTVSEISSGVGNPWSPDRILTTISRSEASRSSDEVGKLGVFGEINVPKMTAKYQDEAKSIIAKEKKEGIAYLNRALRNLDKYNQKLRYLKVSDNNFLDAVFKDLYRAVSSLEYIGRNLHNLMSQYNKAFKTVYEERVGQTEKNRELASGLNATTAMRRYDRSQVRKEKAKEIAKDVVGTISGKLKERKELKGEGKEPNISEYAQISKKSVKEILKRLVNNGGAKPDQAAIISDFTKLKKKTESGIDKSTGTKIEKSAEQRGFEAMAFKIYLDLWRDKKLYGVKHGYKDETAEEILNKEFEEKYNNLFNSRNSEYTKLNADELFNQINKEIKGEPELKHGETENEKPEKETPWKKLSSIPKRVASNIVKRADEQGTVKTGTYGETQPAKNFEGETPEEPTENMNIVQYATYKAKKNNSK